MKSRKRKKADNMKVIDFLDNYTFCHYIDDHGYNAYGYLHSFDTDFIRLLVEKGV